MSKKNKMKLISCIAAAALMSTSFTGIALADDNLVFAPISNVVTAKISTDNKDSVVLFEGEEGEVSPIYAAMDAELVKSFKAGEKYDVTVDLSGLEMSMLDDGVAQALLDQFTAIIKEHNVVSGYMKCGKNYAISDLQLTVDNTHTIDEFIAAVGEKAKSRLENEDEYNTYKSVIDTFPYALYCKLKGADISAMQARFPQLAFIKTTDNSSRSDTSFAQRDGGSDEFDFSAKPRFEINYIRIAKEQFDAFTTKLDDVAKEIDNTYQNATPAQKVMAVHDWIIDNTKYGYRMTNEQINYALQNDYNVFSDGNAVIFDVDEYDAFYSDILENNAKAFAQQSFMDSQSDLNGDGVINDLDMDIYVNSDPHVVELHTAKAIAHSAYGPLMKGNGVCQGYSLLFTALLNKLGIESGSIVSDKLNHQWNGVKLNDEWYYTDVTWDDPVPNKDIDSDEHSVVSLGKYQLHYQLKDNHSYSNLLCDEAAFIENKHLVEGDTLDFIDCDGSYSDNSYIGKTNVISAENVILDDNGTISSVNIKCDDATITVDNIGTLGITLSFADNINKNPILPNPPVLTKFDDKINENAVDMYLAYYDENGCMVGVSKAAASMDMDTKSASIKLDSAKPETAVSAKIITLAKNGMTPVINTITPDSTLVNTGASANYIFTERPYDKLVYCSVDNMYYYSYQVNIVDEGGNLIRVENRCYKLPFKLVNEDGTFVKAEKVTEEVYNSVVDGTYTGESKPEKEENPSHG